MRCFSVLIQLILTHCFIIKSNSFKSLLSYQFTGFQYKITNKVLLSVSFDIIEEESLNKLQLNTDRINFSSLKGKSLKAKIYPTLSEVKSILPTNSFAKSTPLSLSYAALDVVVPGLALAFCYQYVLPIVQNLMITSSLINNIAIFGIWSIYSFIIGTLSMGMWVTAHECGHGAFSDNRKLQDFVGYIFHSIVLVPYFSWQRSHAVHHANTNHITDGETHVPPVRETPEQLSGKEQLQRMVGNKPAGELLFGIVQTVLHFVIGWPAYLLWGATGGPSRGITNHFIPYQLRKSSNKSNEPLKQLFPAMGGFKNKVWLSDIGVVGMLAGLFNLGKIYGFGTVAALYGGPFLIINCWLVGYTWLQHTDVDIPHWPAQGYSFMKGAFHTVDRPYNNMFGNGIIDFLHHHIGTTHVLHHIDSTIPHYNAKQATLALKEKYPDLYLYESTPIFKAIWRLATKCYITEKRLNENNEEMFVFVD